MIYSKLIGKSLEEIVHDIIFEQICELTFYDGEILEQKLEDYAQKIRDDVLDEIEDDKSNIKEDLFMAEKRIDYLEELLQENEIKYE